MARWVTDQPQQLALATSLAEQLTVHLPTSSIHHPPSTIQHTTYSIQHTTYNIQHTIHTNTTTLPPPSNPPIHVLTLTAPHSIPFQSLASVLVSLDLSRCSITNTGAMALADALSHAPRLGTLSLGHNQVQDDGARSLQAAAVDRVELVEAADEAIVNGLGVGRRPDDALGDAFGPGFAVPSLLAVNLDGCPVSADIKEEQLHRAFGAGAAGASTCLLSNDLTASRMGELVHEGFNVQSADDFFVMGALVPDEDKLTNGLGHGGFLPGSKRPTSKVEALRPRPSTTPLRPRPKLTPALPYLESQHLLPGRVNPHAEETAQFMSQSQGLY